MRIGPEILLSIRGFFRSPSTTCRHLAALRESVCSLPLAHAHPPRRGSNIAGCPDSLRGPLHAAVPPGVDPAPAPGARQGRPPCWGGIRVGTAPPALNADSAPTIAPRDDRLGALGFGVGKRVPSGGGGERVGGRRRGIWRPPLVGVAGGLTLSLKDRAFWTSWRGDHALARPTMMATRARMPTPIRAAGGGGVRHPHDREAFGWALRDAGHHPPGRDLSDGESEPSGAGEPIRSCTVGVVFHCGNPGGGTAPCVEHGRAGALPGGGRGVGAGFDRESTGRSGSIGEENCFPWTRIFRPRHPP